MLGARWHESNKKPTFWYFISNDKSTLQKLYDANKIYKNSLKSRNKQNLHDWQYSRLKAVHQAYLQ